ncbi:hypothetical protein AB0B97_10775 [Micromonospora sp. NPDC049004]|uniref:effector-associated constant component EACC1 n=1 Tax=Micromonospora sp. NPDC049004 TaxID=3154348 RepID=UPI003403A3B9
MPEAITIAVRPDLPTADVQRSLASWLRADDRLRDGVALTPPEGTSEGGADVLRVAVEDAGTAMVLVQAVVGWLTNRRDDVSVGFSRRDGWSADLDVPRARDMTQVTALIEATVRAVTPEARRP